MGSNAMGPNALGRSVLGRSALSRSALGPNAMGRWVAVLVGLLVLGAVNYTVYQRERHLRAGELVLLDSSGRLPAIDGSQLTGIGAASVAAGLRTK